MNYRKIIYSALVGDYDEIPKYSNKIEDGWELIMFTDQTNEEYCNGWKIYPLQHVVRDDNVRTNRWHKINAHLLFDNCLCSIYIDCNIHIKDKFIFRRSEELIRENVMLALISHPSRKCVYEEALACIRIGKDLKRLIQENIDFLRSENYPENNGMYENNLIYRNHGFNQVKNINELWWSIVVRMARRDQLSLVYVLWKLKINPTLFLGSTKKTLRNHTSFEYINKHKINNNKFELSENELNEIKQKHADELEQKIQKIKKTISYKIFYKIELGIINLFKKK